MKTKHRQRQSVRASSKMTQNSLSEDAKQEDFPSHCEIKSSEEIYFWEASIKPRLNYFTIDGRHGYDRGRIQCTPDSLMIVAKMTSVVSSLPSTRTGTAAIERVENRLKYSACID